MAEEESVQVDRYLDGLLGERFGEPRELPAKGHAAFDLEQTAALVQRALARFHPSFAFEERLALRLRTDGDPGTHSTDANREPTGGELVQFPLVDAGSSERRPRGLLVGGAIASGVSLASVSIAGAAYLVRRRQRPGNPGPGNPVPGNPANDSGRRHARARVSV